MLDYIIRRVLFIIPTLLGIMFLNFLLVQFVPGGPVEQMIYQFENGSNLDLVGGGGSDAGQENNSNQSLSNDSKYTLADIENLKNTLGTVGEAVFPGDRLPATLINVFSIYKKFSS